MAFDPSVIVNQLSGTVAGLSSLPGGSLTAGLVLFVVVFVVASIAFSLLSRLAKRLAAKTETELDDKLIACLQLPLSLLAIFLAAYVALMAIDPVLTVADRSLNEVFLIAGIGIVTIAVARVVNVLIWWYGVSIMPKTESKIDDELFPIVRKVASWVIYLSGAIIILTRLGIEVTPLIGALGIGSLAVALALQDSLSNFFSGMHILADKPVKVGDYITVGTEFEGFIQEIGWRSTRVLTLDNDTVIIPNSKLAQSVIHNYSGHPVMSFPLEVGVSYDADPDQVEAALKDAASQVLSRDEGGVMDPAPVVRFVKFGDSNMQFKLFYYIKNYKFRPRIRHALHKAVWKTFRERGIEIPYPQTVVHWKGPAPGNKTASEKAEPKAALKKKK